MSEQITRFWDKYWNQTTAPSEACYVTIDQDGTRASFAREKPSITAYANPFMGN